MHSRKALGFTLIELLVVIAIIGLLSSIVLAFLNTARGRANDVAVKENLANIRSRAEILFDTNGYIYDIDAGPTAVPLGACTNGGAANSLFADPTINLQIAAAVDAGPKSYSNTGCAVSTNARGWAVTVPLKQVPSTSWCVDSRGASEVVTPAGLDRGLTDNDATANTDYSCK